jgi:hypothetical protein
MSSLQPRDSDLIQLDNDVFDKTKLYSSSFRNIRVEDKPIQLREPINVKLVDVNPKFIKNPPVDKTLYNQLRQDLSMFGEIKDSKLKTLLSQAQRSKDDPYVGNHLTRRLRSMSVRRYEGFGQRDIY